MLNPGDILFYKDFQFPNGEVHDKRFVVLNDAVKHGVALTLKTTSNHARYTGCVQGCNKTPVIFFAPMTWQACFTMDTFIQIPIIFRLHTADLIARAEKNIVSPKGSLTADCWAQLKACLATHKEDIAPTNWNLIYKG